MPKYRKKPVVIEAIQWTGTEQCWLKMVDFIGKQLKARPSFDLLIIRTLEGDLAANEMDYIIKGIAGEFYPCKPDIFKETYELVEEI